MSDIPAGPRALPIVGNIHQFGSKLHETFNELYRQYGEVFSLKFGTRKVIVLNGSKAIEQVLITQSTDFAGRPEDFATLRSLNSARGGTYSLSTYGDGWKFLHGFLVKALPQAIGGANESTFGGNVSEEALKLIEFVTARGQPPVFDADVLLSHSAVNLQTRFMFSAHYELEDPFLRDFLEVNEKLWSQWQSCGIFNALPWMAWLLPSRKSDFEALIRRQMEILKTIRDEQKRDYVEGSTKDLMSCLRTEAAALDSGALDEVGLTPDKLHDLVVELFAAGGHGNTYTFLNWAFLYAIVFPELQEEIQGEIDAVVGRERTPTLADREKLPLTEAFLVEVTRHSCMAPLTPPHCPLVDTVLEGDFDYAIPEGTAMFCNLASIFYDPELWEEPDQFNPRRFLKGGDVSGSQLDAEKVRATMRFGGGTRLCTGYKVATAQVFLFFAVVMHQCSLKNVAGQELSLEGSSYPFGVRPPKTKMELLRR